MAQDRIALLIDADNASANAVDAVLSDLAGYGEVSVRRAYGNWTKAGLKPWVEVLAAAAIRPMQQFDLTAHKNASDMALVIDAVELHHAAAPTAFAIMSSDSDFTPLAHYLREKGCQVFGYGEAKAPAPFQSACTRFTVVSRLVDSDDAARDGSDGSDATDVTAVTEVRDAARNVRTPTAQELKGDSRLMNLLRSSIASASGEDGWALVSTVGQRVGNQSSQTPRNYGFASWSKLLAAIDLFEMRDLGTSQVAVRDPKAKG